MRRSNEKPLPRPFPRPWLLIGTLLAAYAVLAAVTDAFIMTDERIHAVLEHRIEPARWSVLTSNFRSFSRLSLFLSPLLMGIRLLFTAFWIQAPFLLKDLDLSFGSCIRIVTRAQFSRLGLAVLQSIRMTTVGSGAFNQSSPGIIPLSLASILTCIPVSHSLYTLFSQINVFECIWIILVSEGLAALGRLHRKTIYPVVLLLWILLICFQWTLGTVFIQWLQ